MKKIRRSFRILILAMLSSMALPTPGAFGITVRAREKFGTIQSIDFQTRRLTINPVRDAQPLTLIWNSQTRFLQDWHFTTVERLKRGTQVTVYYHSPFFGDRFATKVLWATGTPLSKTNKQRQRVAIRSAK